jgi:hypothetical protein
MLTEFPHRGKDHCHYYYYYHCYYFVTVVLSEIIVLIFVIIFITAIIIVKIAELISGEEKMNALMTRTCYGIFCNQCGVGDGLIIPLIVWVEVTPPQVSLLHTPR